MVLIANACFSDSQFSSLPVILSVLSENAFFVFVSVFCFFIPVTPSVLCEMLVPVIASFLLYQWFNAQWKCLLFSFFIFYPSDLSVHSAMLVPVIAVKPSSLPYLDALLPKDHDLDLQELQMQHKLSADASLAHSAMMTTSTAGLDESGDGGGAGAGDASRYQQQQDSAETDAIDNPYLRAFRFPKKKR